MSSTSGSQVPYGLQGARGHTVGNHWLMTQVVIVWKLRLYVTHQSSLMFSEKSYQQEFSDSIKQNITHLSEAHGVSILST